MNRRGFLRAVSAAAMVAAPTAATAQPAPKVPRVGFLYFGSSQTGVGADRYAAFLGGLRELGYLDGKNVIVEAR